MCDLLTLSTIKLGKFKKIVFKCHIADRFCICSAKIILENTQHVNIGYDFQGSELEIYRSMSTLVLCRYMNNMVHIDKSEQIHCMT